MTTPAPQQQPPPPPAGDDGLGDAALAVAVAAVLVTAVSAASAVALLKRRFALPAATWQALGGVLTDVMQTPPPVTGVIGAASEQTSRMNAARRAQYVIAATRRVMGAARDARAKGTPVTAAIRDQLATERRFYAQHQAAMWNRATAAGKTDMAAVEHGPLLGWNTVLDDRTSAECMAADRKNFYATAMPHIGFPGAVHPHCFPAGTKVVSPSVLLGAARRYVGEFVEIVTADGYDLTVTPNHPILTPQGYRAAGELDDRSYVVRALDPGAACAAGDPYEHDVVALIEDVLGAGAGPGRVATGTVPVAAVDFHGDGLDHQVAVVRADRELMHRVQVGQPLGIEHFRGAPGRLAVLGAGDLGPVPDRLTASAHGGVSRLGVARMLLGAAVSRQQAVSVGDAAELDAVLAEEPGQRHPAHAEIVGERLDALASVVAFDQVRQVRRFRDSTHVYNLQTTTGWYTANSILVHNCRCYPGPPWPGAALLPSRGARYARAA